MDEDERRQAMDLLAAMTRQLGWEDLVDIPVRPDGPEGLEADPQQARPLVTQLIKLVQDLALVEADLLIWEDDVETLSFKPDVGADAGRFEHGLHIDRQQVQERRRIFANALKTLRTLEERFDDYLA